MKKRPDRFEAARKAWRTRRVLSAFAKVRASEAASKRELRRHCRQHGWKLAFFERGNGRTANGHHRRDCLSSRARQCRLARRSACPVERREGGHQWLRDFEAQEGECWCHGELAHRCFRRRDVESVAR